MRLLRLFQNQQQIGRFQQCKLCIPGIPVEYHRVFYLRNAAVHCRKAVCRAENMVFDGLARREYVALQPTQQHFFAQLAKPEQNDAQPVPMLAG